MEILVVDDEVLIRSLLKEGLTRKGYSVTTASNSQEALDILKSEPDKYAIVLSDIIMPPGISGVELLHCIRREMIKTKVILMTGYAFEENLPEDTKVIIKPVDMKSLYKIIEETLAR